ncbi:Cna B-type domain-containing protein, partial [Clostridiales bacterium COT073_COT-073]
MKRKIMSIALVFIMLFNLSFQNLKMLAEEGSGILMDQTLEENQPLISSGPAITASGTAIRAGEDNRERKDVLADGTLQDYKKTVVHKGKILEDGDEIDLSYPIDINIRFKMPVKGDFLNGEYDQNQVVLKGDHALINLSKGIEFIGNPVVELRGNVLVDGEKALVGHFSLGTLTDGTLQAKIDFDGDDKIYNGTLRDVNVEAVLTVQVREEWIPDAEGKIIEIFGHKYKAKLPKKFESISKSGELLKDAQGKIIPQIKWTIEVEYKTEGGSLVDLGGYKVYDDLATNKEIYSNKPAEYKNVHSVMLNGQPLNGAYDLDTKKLEYVFPKGTFGKQTITYITDLFAKDFYVTNAKEIENKAELYKEKPANSGNYEKIKERTARVYIPTSTWIEKRAGVQNFNEKTLEWDIRFNHGDEPLKNVKITDKLEQGMTFVSAIFEKWDRQEKKWKDPRPITPNAKNEFIIGDVDVYSHLLIKVKVDIAQGETIKQLHNEATITIEPTPGDVATHTAEWQIGFGERLLNKYSTKAEWVEPEMEWRFEIPKAIKSYFNGAGNNSNKVVKVYDLFVFEKEITEEELKADSNQRKITGLPAGMEIKDIIPTNMGYLKYVPDSFANQNAGVSFSKVYEIRFDGIHIADLVEVEVNIAQENKDGGKFAPWSYTLKAVPMDRTYVHELRGIRWITNSAFLYHDKKQIFSTYTSSRYLPRMLDKQMLTVNAARDLKAGHNPLSAVNTISQNRKDGFDEDVINDPNKKNEGAVVYRLVLNANQHPYLKESLGSLELKDLLPKGWEFTKIAGKDFLMYEAKPTIEDVKKNKSIYQELKAVTAIQQLSDADVSALVDKVTVSKDKKDMTISLPKTLDKSYVVLVAARPGVDKITAYKASANSNIIEINRAELKHIKTNVFDGSKPSRTISKDKDVEFNIGLIGKSAESLTGLVEWTVLANPYAIEGNYDSYWLEDKLGDGIEMRLDGAGKVLESDYHLYARDKTASNWTILPKTGYTFEYNKGTKTIKVNLPEKDKAYRFIYKTEIIALAATDVSNTVKILGKDKDLGHTEHKYRVQEINAKVNYGMNGAVEIYKINQAKEPVKNAEFTLTNNNDPGKFTKGVTSSSGTLTFRPIQPGTYTLKETVVPEGYTGTPKATVTGYTVVVTEENVGGVLKVTTTVDGEVYNGKQLIIENSKVENADLTITKKVEGAGADQSKKFKFTITFTGTGADSEYDVEPGNATLTGKIKSGDSFELTHNQKITIKNLPIGLGYKLVEADYSAEGYIGKSNNASGVIQSGDNSSLFTNTYTAKINIPVEKRWVGPEKDSVKVYLQINGNDVDPEKSITLSKGNWKGEFKDLPKYNPDGSEIAYGIREDVPAGYEHKIEGDKQKGFIITNTNVEKIKIPVEK